MVFFAERGESLTMSWLRETKFDKWISLGVDCGVKYQLSRNKFKRYIENKGDVFNKKDFERNLYATSHELFEEETHFFDWLITPLDSITALIKNRFSDAFCRENLRVYSNGKTVKETTTNIFYPHNFSTKNGVITEEIIDREYRDQANKIEYLKNKFMRNLEADAPILYVATITEYGKESFLKLVNTVETMYGKSAYFLGVIAKPQPRGLVEEGSRHAFYEIAEEINKPDAEKWQGDDSEWEKVFQSIQITVENGFAETKPEDQGVVVFAANDMAQKYIRRNRRNERICFVVDSYKTGFLMGYPIIPPKALLQNRKQYHTIIVCSVDYRDEIVGVIHSMGVGNKHIVFFNPEEIYQGLNPYEMVDMLKPIDVCVVAERQREVQLAFSVVVPVFNEKVYIDDFLRSLEKQTLLPSEILLVDGGSTDGTIEKLIAYSKESRCIVRVISNPHEGSTAGNRNVGIRAAANEVLVLVDAHTILDKEYFQCLMGCYEQHPDADLVAGIYYSMNKNSSLAYNWSEFDEWNTYIPGGATISVKKSLVLKAGGFPMHCEEAGEDTLFMVNYRRNCHKWIFNTEAFVWWHDAKSKADESQKMFRYGFGDGLSGIAEYRYSWLYDAFFSGNFSTKYEKGFYSGRLARAQNQMSQRNIKEVYVVFDEGFFSTPTLLQRIKELQAHPAKVVYVYSLREQSWNCNRIYADVDVTLLEMYHVGDFDAESFLKDHAGWQIYPEAFRGTEANLAKAYRGFEMRLCRQKLRLLKQMKQSQVNEKNVISSKDSLDVENHIERMLAVAKAEKKRVYYFHKVVDYHVPLFGRLQQIAKQLADMGHIVFFASLKKLDSFSGYQQVGEGHLYLIDDTSYLEKIPGLCFYFSNLDVNVQYDTVKTLLDRDQIVIMDCFDELSAEIIGQHITDSMLNNYENMAKDNRIVVIASAEKIKQDIEKIRTGEVYLITNGVDNSHFSLVTSNNKLDCIPQGQWKYIAGYYGAFASWLDYELLEYAADRLPHVLFLLIGVDYDGGYRKSRLQFRKNVVNLGYIPYAELPRYACNFDVALIPFLINKVTQATSPVKLFEYMAMGKPVVSTYLKECRKYPLVYCAASKEQFVEYMEMAYKKSLSREYRESLRECGLANDWAQKAMELDELVACKTERYKILGKWLEYESIEKM